MTTLARTLWHALPPIERVVELAEAPAGAALVAVVAAMLAFGRM